MPPSEDEEDGKAKEIDTYLMKFGGRRLCTYYSLDGMRMISEFEAPDVEAVHTSYALANSNCDCIWLALVKRDLP